MASSKLFINQAYLEKGEDDIFALAFARIETHYFVNGSFLKSIKDFLTLIIATFV